MLLNIRMFEFNIFTVLSLVTLKPKVSIHSYNESIVFSFKFYSAIDFNCIKESDRFVYEVFA